MSGEKDVAIQPTLAGRHSDRGYWRRRLRRESCLHAPEGYRRITLFDANDRIGGKVETVKVEAD